MSSAKAGRLSQVVLLVSEYVLSSVITLGVSIFSLRHWGPVYSGLITQAQTVVGILAVFAFLGLDMSLVKYLTMQPDRTGQMLGTALRLRLIGNALLILALAILSFLLGLTSADQIMLIVIAFGGQAIQSLVIFGYKFSAAFKTQPLVLTHFLQTVAFSLLRLALMKGDCSIYVFQASFALEAVFSYFVTKWLFNTHFGKTELAWDPDFARTLIKESAPIVLSAFFVTAFLKIDILIISRMLPIGEVGIYSAAMRIVETYMIAISVFFSQSLVWLTESHQDKALYQIRLSRLFKAGFAISLACLLFNMFAGEVLFSYLLGSKYTDAARLSTLLCFTLFATTSGTIRGYAFSLDGLNRFHFWSALLGLVLGVPLTIVLTKEMGLKGTAVALSVAYFVSAIGTSIVFPPLRLLARLQLLLRPSYPGATGSVHS